MAGLGEDQHQFHRERTGRATERAGSGVAVEQGGGIVIIPPAERDLINADLASDDNETGFTGGLQAGDRVVVQGASLIAQIR